MAEYVKTDWVDNATLVDEARMDKIEQGIADAVAKDPVVAAAIRLVASKLAGADAQPAFRILGNGLIEWGPGGSTVPDTVLQRTGVNSLHTTAALTVNSLLVDSEIVDTGGKWFVNPDGSYEWGPGDWSRDTNLYRSAASRLATDDKFDPAAINMPTKAGVPIDADIVSGAQDGDTVVDTTGKKLYTRIGGTWQAVGGGGTATGVVNVLDYGAVAGGVTDCTTAFRNAYLALPATGGTILVPPGVYKGFFEIDDPAKKCKISGYGATINVPPTQWGVYVHYGSGGDPESCIIEGLYFDCATLGGEAGVGIEGSDRVRIRDIVTWGGTWGIVIGAYVTGQFCEGTHISNCFIRYPTAKGIWFRKFGSENTSFGETTVEDVGIQLGAGSPIGIHIDGDIYRSHFSGVTVFQVNGNTGIVIDGNVYGVSFHGGVESFQDGTGQIGIWVGSGAQNTLSSDWNVVFTGNFAIKVACDTGKDLNTRMGNDHRVLGNGTGGRGMRMYQGMTEPYPRVEIAGGFAGGGGILLGPGGGSPDVQLYRNAAGQLETNGAFKALGGISPTVFSKITDQDVYNTAAETTLFSFPMAAGLLTDALFRIVIVGDYVWNQNSGMTLRLKIGAQVGTIPWASSSNINAARKRFSHEIYLWGQGNSSAEYASKALFTGAFVTAADAAGDSNGIGNVAGLFNGGVVTQDLSIAQTLALTAQWAAATTALSWRAKLVTVERLA